MNPFTKASDVLMSGMRAQSHRMQVVSENLANVDTHGYKRKLISFENIYDRASEVNNVKIGPIALDQKEGAQIFDPTHPLANEDGYVTASNVDMMIEFADAREANRSYEAGLEVFRQARDMYGSLLDILRR